MKNEKSVRSTWGDFFDSHCIYYIRTEGYCHLFTVQLPDNSPLRHLNLYPRVCMYVGLMVHSHPRLKDVGLISKLCKILFISVTSAKTLDVS